MQTLLTIAGFDPSSGAGVTADLAVFAAHGYFGTSAVTALTVQNTTGVEAVHAADAALLSHTLACLANDLPPAGIKIGMLATAANVRAVAAFVRELKAVRADVPVVLDPVLRSSSGRELLTGQGLEVLREELLPFVNWITPNRAELAELVGRTAETEEQVCDAAGLLLERFPGLSVVVTGGDGEQADDLLLSSSARQWLRAQKIDSTSTHGTGCAFSSALLAAKVNGMNSVEACQHAKTYVRRAIVSAPELGRGRGPMNLLWPLQKADSPPLKLG